MCLQYLSQYKKRSRQKRRSKRRKKRTRLMRQTRRRRKRTRRVTTLAQMMPFGVMLMEMDARLITSTLTMAGSPRMRLVSTMRAQPEHTVGRRAILVSPWAAQPHARISSVYPSGMVRLVSVTHAKTGRLSVLKIISLPIAHSRVASVLVQAQRRRCRPLLLPRQQQPQLR